MKHEVFISYKTEEFDEANWVKSTLETNGISCWMAPMCIPGGSSYAQEIPKAIRECQIFVLILSAKSQESKWVPKELDQAICDGKTIMPFALENCALKDDFNFYLSNIQRYQAYESKVLAMKKMIREIRAHLGKASVLEEVDILDEAKEQNVAEKEKRESKTKKNVKQENLKKRKTTTLPILKYGLYLLLAFVLTTVLVSALSKTKIAGEKIRRNNTYLHLKDCEISEKDWAKITKMKKLSYVEFENCKLPEENFGEICNDNIRHLELRNCNLSKKQVLNIDFEKLENLQTLDLSGNSQVTDLEGVSAISEQLYCLDISGTGITDLDFLDNFTKLSKLYANDNGILSVQALENCVNLEEISLNGNQLTDFSGLESCIKLKKISACDNRIVSLKGLENTSILSEVFLDNNLLTDISEISDSYQNLKKISVNQNQLSDLSAIKLAENLESLFADGNQIKHLAELEEKKKLQELSVRNNKLESLDGIEQCEALEYMNFSNNNIQNIEVLDEMSLLGTNIILNLEGNQIRQLHIPKVEKYSFLSIFDNPFEDIEVLYENSYGELVIDYLEKLEFEKLSENVNGTCWIVDCPLGKQVKVADMLGSYKCQFVETQDAVTTVNEYILKRY